MLIPPPCRPHKGKNTTQGRGNDNVHNRKPHETKTQPTQRETCDREAEEPTTVRTRNQPPQRKRTQPAQREKPPGGRKEGKETPRGEGTHNQLSQRPKEPTPPRKPQHKNLHTQKRARPLDQTNQEDNTPHAQRHTHTHGPIRNPDHTTNRTHTHKMNTPPDTKETHDPLIRRQPRKRRNQTQNKR